MEGGALITTAFIRSSASMLIRSCKVFLSSMLIEEDVTEAFPFG